MRQPVHDSLVRFRASEALIAEAEARARQRHMTLSELLRQVVRREVAEAA